MLDRLQMGDVLILSDQTCLFIEPDYAPTSLARLRDRGVLVHLADLAQEVTRGAFADAFNAVLRHMAHAVQWARSDQMVASKAEARRTGLYMGGRPPVGKVVGSDGRLIDDHRFQRIYRKILKLRATRSADGRPTSFRKIAEIITAAGYPISHQAVATLLRDR
jgi:hypothetical protein